MIIKFKDLSYIRKKHSTEKIVFVGGCYDLLHVGHLNFLERCKKFGDVLVVATSSDERIRERKGSSRPIIPENHRVVMLSALSCVDYALVAPKTSILFGAPTVRILHSLRPNVFAVSDLRHSDYKLSLANIGIEVEFVPYKRITSTTEIIQKVINNSS